MQRKPAKKERNRRFGPADAILESISDGVFTVDRNWRITSFNRAAERITGVSKAEAAGRLCSEVFRSSMCGPDCALQKTMQTGKPVVGRSCFIVRADGERVPISVSTAVLKDEKGRITGGAETFRDLSDVEELRKELEGRSKVGELISRSPLMAKVFEILPAIAASPSTVLVLGETGTGKELVARTIHELSPRKNGPFVAINCGALPETLLESELFGYKAGAFTGASKDKPGRFAAARNGTLFLDEIGEITPALQVRLLRVLQEREYVPLGSNKPVKAEARIVTATNRDLRALTAEGGFREDLYYRINVVRIEIPPLRRRKEDLPLLSAQFVKRFNRLQGREVEGLSAEALSLLMAHDWPGNVRELENVIERAFVVCPGREIGIECLPDELTASGAASRGIGLRSARAASEADLIADALRRCGGNRTAAAKDLGIHKTTLLRKAAKLGIRLPESDGRKAKKTQS